MQNYVTSRNETEFPQLACYLGVQKSSVLNIGTSSSFKFSNILATKITEDTCIVEMHFWSIIVHVI